MPQDIFENLVAIHKGWIEDDGEDGVARFPSVWHKEQFEKAINAYFSRA